MSGITPVPDLEERKLALEERKAAIAERQLEFDNRWVKVWGPALLGGIFSLVVAIISGAGVGITALITSADKHAQIQETVRENNSVNHEKALEGERAAAEMYFDKLGDLENKDQLTDVQKKRLVNDLHIIAILADKQEFSDIFKQEATIVYTSLRSETSTIASAPSGLGELSDLRQLSGPALSAGSIPPDSSNPALQGLPDLVSAPTPGQQYNPATFIAFPQVPGTQDPNEEKFFTGLVSLGFKVQATQHMAIDKSPLDNEVRYYLPDQADFATDIARKLSIKTSLKFVAWPLHVPGLPNGVMEFWLGTASLKPRT